MTSAEQVVAIDAQIEREFSFAQELIWSHPHKNPYPLCTDKIIAGMTKLRNLLQEESADLDRSKKIRKRAKQLTRILEKDAQALIECRLKYIRQVRNVTLLLPRDDVDRTVDGIIVRHMNNAWTAAEDSVSKMLQAGGVDWKHLYSDIDRFFESLSDKSGLTPAADEVLKADDAAKLAAGEQQESSVSDFQQEKAEVRGLLQGKLAFLDRASASHATPPNMKAKSEASAYHEEFPSSKLPNLTDLGMGSALTVHPPAMSTTRHPNEKPVDKCESGPSAAVAMNMKATLCGAQSSEPWWHILFSLINKGADDLAVDALSIWSLIGETRLSTIRWPKGDAVLKAESSFLCYSTQWPSNGTYNSPMVGYSWRYRSITTQAATTREPEPESTEEKVDPEGTPSSLRKRLGNVVSWIRSVKMKSTI